MPRDVWGFDAKTGQPKEWPMRYSWALWTVTGFAFAGIAYLLFTGTFTVLLILLIVLLLLLLLLLS